MSKDIKVPAYNQDGIVWKQSGYLLYDAIDDAVVHDIGKSVHDLSGVDIVFDFRALEGKHPDYSQMMSFALMMLECLVQRHVIVDASLQTIRSIDFTSSLVGSKRICQVRCLIRNVDEC